MAGGWVWKLDTEQSRWMENRSIWDERLVANINSVVDSKTEKWVGLGESWRHKDIIDNIESKKSRLTCVGCFVKTIPWFLLYLCQIAWRHSWKSITDCGSYAVLTRFDERFCLGNRRSRDNTEATKTSAPQRPRPPAVHTTSNNNNNSSGGGKVAEPSRAAPVPPSRPTQPAAYSVSTGVSILPVRAAPAPPAKPPQPSQPPQPPAKPPRPGADVPPAQPLDPRRLRPVAAGRSDANRPPLPQKPAVS